MLSHEERIAEVKRRIAEKEKKKSIKKGCGRHGSPPFPAWQRVLR
mgnify:CR=1 FL=1